MKLSENNEKMLLNCLDALSFLRSDREESYFVYMIKEDKLVFTEAVDKKYNLPAMTDNVYTFNELERFLIPGDEKRKNLSIEQYTDPQTVYEREYTLVNRDGEHIGIHCVFKVICDNTGAPMWLLGKFSSLAFATYTDEITGLPNARKLTSDMKKYISNGECGYLMLFGIDNFKGINTRYGRSYGDRVLHQTAQTMRKLSNDKIYNYRIDGDKFSVILLGAKEADVKAHYLKISENLSRQCTISAGIVCFGGSACENAEEIYQNAENAMDQAKLNGKKNYIFYTEQMHDNKVMAYELHEELRQSIMHSFDGFYLNYQPQIDGKSYEILGAEALIRYVSLTRGVISPDEFIPVLEGNGMIVDVGMWVLKNALSQCKEWRKVLPDFHISVNISYIQLQDPGFADDVLKALKEIGLQGECLTLEITESMQLQNYQFYNQIFKKLAENGITISIDDFGTGYSSLSYLKILDVDEIKIDRCFVSNIQHSAYNYRLLNNMVELAHSVDIKVCCEGIETDEELVTLMQMHVDSIQGFLFSKPLNIDEFSRIYIDKNIDLHDNTERKKIYYREMSRQYNNENQLSVEKETLATIVDSMEEIVYVRSGGGHELLYLNAAGRDKTGVYDYKGKKCYEVLMNRDTPCECCQKDRVESGEYLVWEIENKHLGGHYILKDRTMLWHGETAQLTIAIDVTEKEILSQRIKEKLEFESNIVSCSKMLAEETDRNAAINGLLKAIGEFYVANRAYLFEASDKEGCWNNTFEWCSDGTEAQSHLLQDVENSVVRRWLAAFNNGESIIIDDVDKIKDICYEEWEALDMQGIRCLIAAPVRKDGELIGFIGVDDPKKYQQQAGHVETISCFLADRIIGDRTRDRLNELLNLHSEDVLKETALGLWVIKIGKDGEMPKMYVDKTMRKILGIHEKLSPEECYNHWYSRIHDGYFNYVNYGVENMIDNFGKKVELEYTWDHPEKGATTVRCVGMRNRDIDGMICLEGYHREINEIDRPHFLPDAESIVFEYNSETQTVYFHQNRGNLDVHAEKKENFPQCWINNKMVHPHYAAQFTEVFLNADKKQELSGMEILLKTVDGDYGWYKMKTHFPDSEDGNASNMFVLLDPAEQERTMELDYLRQMDFYNALLSETIAFAEVDLESKHITAVGGLWESYADEKTRNELSYMDVLCMHLEDYIYPDDKEAVMKFLQADTTEKLIAEGKSTEKLEFRRLIDGRMQWVEISGHIFKEEFSGKLSALLYLKDIDAEKCHDLAQEHAATRDPLTNVFNRNAFEKEVVKYMTEESDTDSCGVIIMMDIDGFKIINDTLGHLEGDRILKQFVEVLMTTFRRKDVIGRIGGDEFVVFLKSVTDREIINKRLTELKTTLSVVSNRSISCSVGVAFARKDNFSYEDCLRRADKAMYKSKMKGKNTHSYYAEEE